MADIESNKARIAKRVIDVLDFFDEQHTRATVMDIVRRFDWPQSSTSELLSNLVHMGLLHKDRHSRSYALTPRAALLGGGVQPGPVRDGRLARLIDRLAAQTGLGVAAFGMVGLRVQVSSWRAGKRPLRVVLPGGFANGEQEALTHSAAGWLLLSTVAQPARDAMIRRMSAEAAPERRVTAAEMSARAEQCRGAGHAHGPVGFGATAEVTAMLLPGMPETTPVAIGFVYEPSKQLDAATLLRSLADAIARCDEQAGSVQPLFNAA